MDTESATVSGAIILVVVRRFYVHNFRCLENFELRLAGQSSVLLIGKNGSGKSSVAAALRILQQIARGKNRTGELVEARDFAGGRTNVPMRFEIEVELNSAIYEYSIAFELPNGLKEPRVAEEKLSVDGRTVYAPELAPEQKTLFQIDWHVVALPIVQQRSAHDPIAVFRDWLARTLILRPVPSLMDGESKDETLQPTPDLGDFAGWFAGVLAHAPSAYNRIDRYLRELMPDLKDIRNPIVGKDSRSLEVHFSRDQASLKLDFADLSDGEKCFMISAVVLAANEAYGPLLCFWDEPDNHLDLSEVSHFVLGLRKAFQSGGQFIATSHNPEAIRAFSDENTLMLFRRSHLEPTAIRPVSEMQIPGDLIGALVRGDMEP